MNREVAVSKALSKLLRHAAEDAGLSLDGEGFARLDQVVSLYSPVPWALLLESIKNRKSSSTSRVCIT
jgi:RNA:NAD 2'-phosphotransferase (TPT1/KptA family)